MATERAELLRARAATYRMGAAALHPTGPSPEVLALLRVQGLTDGASEAFGDEIGDALRTFADEESDVEVKRDYDALFVVPSGARIVLTENFIRTDAQGKRRRKPFQGPTTAEVAQFYQRAGFSFDKSGLADHVSVELEFMALLSTRLADKLESDESAADQAAAERAFLLEHLVPWVQILSEASASARTRGLAAIMSMVAAVIVDHAGDFGVDASPVSGSAN